MHPDPRPPFDQPRNHAEEIMNARFYLEQDRLAQSKGPTGTQAQTQPRPDGMDDFEAAIRRAQIREYEEARTRLDRVLVPLLALVALALLLLPLLR